MLVVRQHFDFVAQVLFEIRLETGQLERVAHADDATNRRRLVETLEVTNAALDLCHEIVEHRTHRLEDLLRVFCFARIALEVLGLTERQLQLFRQLFGEVVTTQRNATLPDSITVCHDEVGRVRSHRQDDDGLGRDSPDRIPTAAAVRPSRCARPC